MKISEARALLKFYDEHLQKHRAEPIEAPRGVDTCHLALAEHKFARVDRCGAPIASVEFDHLRWLVAVWIPQMLPSERLQHQANPVSQEVLLAIGFVRGALWTHGQFSLDELRAHLCLVQS